MDARLFAGRDAEHQRITNAVTNHWNVLLTGPAGIGKTSLMNKVAFDLRRSGAAQPHPIAFVYAHALSDATSVLTRVAHELLPGPFESQDQHPLDLLSEHFPRGGTDHVGAHALVMIDDIAGNAGHDLFGRMRDLLWELEISWVVSTRELTALLTPPADAFFEVRIELAGLNAAEAQQMLQNRLNASDAAGWAKRTGAVVNGNPRRILELARASATTDTPFRDGPASAEALAARQQAIVALGRPAAMLAAELDKLGAASASDPELLASLGWTRPRAVQVLTELERAGLVVADDVRAARGRPKRMYRLVSAQDLPASSGAGR